MTEIPEHLLHRAQQARERAAREAGEPPPIPRTAPRDMTFDQLADAVQVVSTEPLLNFTERSVLSEAVRRLRLQGVKT